jgi:hypothetical protein
MLIIRLVMVHMGPKHTQYGQKTARLAPVGGRVYAWEDGYQPGPNQAEPGLCEYDGGHI